MSRTSTAPNNLPLRTPRDIRADRCGYGNLIENWNKKNKEALKADMLGDKKDLVSGDVFKATLIPSPSSHVDPEKFFKLYEKGKLTKAQFLGCIKVTKEAAQAVTHPVDLANATEDDGKSKSMRIELLQVVPISIVTAVRELAADAQLV